MLPVPPEADKPTRRELREALKRSGYLLESRVDAALRERGYGVYANPSYPDSLTGKLREYDIFALKGHPLSDSGDIIWTYLIIECVNTPVPIAFVGRDRTYGVLPPRDVITAGIPVVVPDPEETNSTISLQDYLGLPKYHHFGRGRVATQFASFQQKKGTTTWMAFHDEQHFDALRKLPDVLRH
ncbi:MAG TPA: hypothetical protein VGR85_06270, partial [Candidatus Limnocylindria bacterium]|nr:hypothetical protein [Candidatus Limnocylindria bacterium]